MGLKKTVAKTVKTTGHALMRRDPRIRNWYRTWIRRRRGALYRKAMEETKVDEKSVTFVSFMGRQYACSPKAIFEYMASSPEFADYRFYWVLRGEASGEAKEALLRRYPLLRKSRIVRFGSEEEYRAYASSAYLITNSRLPDYLVKRPGQKVVQCWHGTPLKRLGFDIEAAGNAMNSLAEIREKYATDAERFRYLLSPCAFATKVFRSAWNLAAYGKEDAILETGYPRNDALASCSTETRERCRAALGFADDKRKLILYAPTWRDNQFRAGVGYTYSNEADFRYLREKLGADYVILFRAHYLVANTFDFSAYSGFVRDVSNVDDINELYLAADILLTDYSSSFFDFAVLGRPIVFYMYDLAAYRSGIRGLYLDPAELPGPVEENIEGAAERILEIGDSFSPDEKYRAFNRTFNSLHDGHAAERFVDAVFRSANT